jgi:tetratricopeptide (TPR) repeat protein
LYKMKALLKTILSCVLLLCASPQEVWAKSELKALVDKGRNSMQSGKHDEAVQAFTDALELLAPDEKNAHVTIINRAQAYLHKGQLKEARKDIDRVLQSEASDGETRAQGLVVRGLIYNRQGQDARALADFTAAIKVPHDSSSLRSAAFANRGMTHLNMGNADKAVSDLNKAIELDPKDAFAYAARGLANLRMDRVEAARADGDRAMRLNPDKTAAKLANTILDELSVSATGPQSVSVPMNEQGHIFVQVRFSKRGKPHRFLLDTGATYSLIDGALLQEIQKEARVEAIGKARVRIADGSTHVVTRYKVNTAFLFTMPLGEVEVHVMENQGQKITNLLGVKSLQNIAVSLDNSERKAELRRRVPSGGAEGD